MIDLTDLRVFVTVASLQSFSAAARALGLPKSSVSRSVSRLEAKLGTRLLQRSTREVRLTATGAVLKERCADILTRVGEAIDYASTLNAAPCGPIKISADTGFGVTVLSELLPQFLERYDDVSISVELTSRFVDLVAEGVDVAIRMGPMPDSGLVARRLGTIKRYLCAAPNYLERRGSPRSLEELRDHDIVEMPGLDGRPRCWSFTNGSDKTIKIETQPRIGVNDPLTIHGLVVNGAGFGCLSAYLCQEDFGLGHLVPLFPEWTLPAIEVSIVFPSNRELSPTVRAFVDFMKNASGPGIPWQD